MDYVLTSEQKTSQKAIFGEKIYPADIPFVLSHYADRLKVLSLDCFDTILWRKTVTPVDMFYDLQHKPSFQSVGMTCGLRVTAESNARKRKLISSGKHEVRLNEIYETHSKQLTKEQLAALSEDELAAEMETCYAFPPIIELIREAHANKLKIIIVSDTYLKLAELTKLLQHTLPKDVFAMIDTIFCSNEYGHSKRSGLFKHVLKKMNLSAKSILHIGDNIISDYYAAQYAKINALHLMHYDDVISNLIRSHGTAASIINPSIRFQRALNYPYRGALAAANLAVEKPEQMLGYAAIGPIMYAFATFIEQEIAALEKSGKKVKIAFLMRDAYLPSLACTALTGKEIGKRVRISRFTAFAASFRTKEDVVQYLADVVTSNRFFDIARQLLIPDEVANSLIQNATLDADPLLKFSRLVLQDNILEGIFKESAKYRQHLKKYLDHELALEENDTLMFVDLGYSGTAQRLLEPIFKDEYGIDIIGRYLITLATPNWESSRRGLLDRSNCDDRAMSCIVTYVALLEQICTSNEASVVSYNEDGSPVFGETSFSDEQYYKLNQLHQECLRFIKDTKQFFQLTHSDIPFYMLRDAAFAELGRLIFMPTESEIEYLQAFQFDLNLGTKDIFNIFDIEKGLTGLRRKGIFSSFMEKSAKTFRTNAPAELRAAGLELSTTLFAQHRFSLEFGMQDINLRREKINIIVMQNQDSTQTMIEAFSTYDGYYSLGVPLGIGGFQIGILFGQNYQWIEIESVSLIDVAGFLTSKEGDYATDYSANALFGQMENRGGTLYECTTSASFMMINPALQPDNQRNYMLRIVFRPVVKRLPV